jgi:hypothetical protein
VAVGQGALDGEEFAGGDEGFIVQEATESLHFLGRPGGEVGEGAFADFGAFADGLAEEDGGRGVAVGDGLDVHGTIMTQLSFIDKSISFIYMGTHERKYITPSARP